MSEEATFSPMITDTSENGDSRATASAPSGVQDISGVLAVRQDPLYVGTGLVTAIPGFAPASVVPDGLMNNPQMAGGVLHFGTGCPFNLRSGFLVKPD